ncbi:cell division protein FtsZ [Lacinutrix sp. C3R15]|uniref:cell division protein FtsZ n=1 Tax=Flavobacteriaceae TaxID=49546 RepID=UPI001C0928E2|nr:MULTISPECIES: cell division protein FtsZ [Flavobacteriaceae]MBU2939238.1 cell division protein FtsZ [Lacinutrix sp. C3R15]MDO6622553.1 cell division protein FtsZ [Oceanihabitans sp. 1_MG-2023]
MSSNKEFETNIAFDLPKNQSNVIKVIGVGGGGSNAINHMFQQGIKGVDFVICNTDAQALQNSGVPNKIQLGLNLTEGLGAGANPDVGEQSAIESFEDLQRMLDTNTKMIFITAGMGGGTGTGAAPIIAKMAKDLDILTVGIVTMPFQFEGKMRNEQAQEGIEKLRNVVDSLIVINNNKLRDVYGNLGFKAGFSKADEVLSTAARGIAEVITHHYTQNIDLRDAKTVLSSSGTAIMGSASSSGQNRAHEAIRKALDSPLLNDNKIIGAKNVLLLIVSGAQEITIDEIGEINDHIQNEAGHGANIIMGVGEDESLDESIAVTIIATGFDIEQQDEISNTETKKVIHTLEEEKNLEKEIPNKGNNPVILKPNIELEKKVAPPIVKHTLDLNDLEDVYETPKKEVSKPENLIPTTEKIKNIHVVHDEVVVPKVTEEKGITETQFKEDTFEDTLQEDDFVITNATPEAETITDFEEEKQITLTFDMPLSAPVTPAVPEIEDTKEEVIEEDNKVVHNLNNEEIKNVPVNDYVELVSVTETNKDGEIRYALDDYLDFESTDESKKKEPQVEIVDKELDQEVFFEKKEVTKVVVKEEVEEIDPMNSPISDALKDRAEERRRKMKDFNYKFNNSKIDDIEKVPAYKRQGVDLHDAQHSSEKTSMSSTSLSIDDNDDMLLRSNNSFLHDNVD